jgi:hypothetical protein
MLYRLVREVPGLAFRPKRDGHPRGRFKLDREALETFTRSNPCAVTIAAGKPRRSRPAPPRDGDSDWVADARRFGLW